MSNSNTQEVKPFRKLLKFIWPHKLHFFVSIGASIINKTLDVLPEIFLGTAVDVINNKPTFLLWFFGIATIKMQLIVLSIISFITWFFESISEYYQITLWKRLAQLIQNNLRLDTFCHVEKLSMEYVDSKTPGEFASIITDDINQLERFLDHGPNSTIHFIIGISIIGFIFFTYAPIIAVLMLIPMPFIFAIAVYFQKRLGPRYLAVRKAASAIGAFIAHDIIGLATIKSYCQEDFELQRLEKKSLNYRELNKNVTAFSAAFAPTVRMVIVLGFITTILLGGFSVLNGKITLGTYSMLIFLTQKLLWPFIKLPELIDLYQRSMASARRVFELSSLPLTVRDGNTKIEPHQACGIIKFDNVSFTYPSGLEVFKDLSLCISPHKSVAFVGSTGSGKSTIAKLLLRLYPEFTGRILLDDLPIQNYKLKDLRQVISYVSQEVFLIDGSIADNIAYGKCDATKKEIVMAAKNAQAYDFIMEMPKKFDTILGENGQQLSGGQKQRIGLARALIRNPAVYIFDEITASVDNETEKLIQDSLEYLTDNKTVIIIAHRLATVKDAKTIYVLDHGKIVEFGSHQELLKKKGLYSHLWELQTGSASS